MRSNIFTKAKRGDTIIEVMFAVVIFSMVAVISISLMNVSLMQSEASLELVASRSDIDTQMEGLRFIHSSYISEMTLPRCIDADPGATCQQYRALWKDIVNGASTASPAAEFPPETCQEVRNLSGAFILNLNQLRSTSGTDTQHVKVPVGKDQAGAASNSGVNARIIYSNSSESSSNILDKGEELLNVTSQGIWIIPVKGNGYYDFYAQACWDPPTDSKAPVTIDTVIRLYDPDQGSYD